MRMSSSPAQLLGVLLPTYLQKSFEQNMSLQGSYSSHQLSGRQALAYDPVFSQAVFMEIVMMV